MFTEQNLADLISDVEKEFSSFLAKAEKDESDSKPEDKKEAKPEAKDDSKEDKAPEATDAPPAETQDAAPAAPSEDAPPAEAAPADEAAPAAPTEDQGHGYDDEDMAHMDAMYSSMSKAELIAHHDSVKRALDAMMAQQAPAPEAPMAPDQAAAPAQDAPPALPMMKSETDVVIEVKPEVIQSSQETEILKSELTAKKGEVEELKKTLEAVTAFVTKLVEKKAAPSGKAITNMEVIAKSEAEVAAKTFSKTEITAILSAKSSDPKLEKSDRQAINAYYEAGQININGISHLLK